MPAHHRPPTALDAETLVIEVDRTNDESPPQLPRAVMIASAADIECLHTAPESSRATELFNQLDDLIAAGWLDELSPLLQQVASLYDQIESDMCRIAGKYSNTRPSP